MTRGWLATDSAGHVTCRLATFNVQLAGELVRRLDAQNSLIPEALKQHHRLDVAAQRVKGIRFTVHCPRDAIGALGKSWYGLTCLGPFSFWRSNSVFARSLDVDITQMQPQPIGGSSRGYYRTVRAGSAGSISGPHIMRWTMSYPDGGLIVRDSTTSLPEISTRAYPYWLVQACARGMLPGERRQCLAELGFDPKNQPALSRRSAGRGGRSQRTVSAGDLRGPGAAPHLGAVQPLQRLTARPGWQFFAVLPRADSPLATVWWVVLVLRGVLPALFAIVMGALIAAVQRGSGLGAPLAATGVAFVLLQVLPPIHTAVGTNLGDRTAAWLYDRLTQACVRPPGVAHLEDPELTSDLTTARDFDLGMTGPPLSISMDFIASGLAEMIGGVSSAIVLARYAWWAPALLVAAWLATHWLLRESAVWRDRNTPEVRAAQRHAEYAYRLAVDPPASKELRLFGLAGWTLDRFVAHRTTLHRLQYEATRLHERPLLWSVLVVAGANLAVFVALALATQGGRLTIADLVVYGQCAIGVSLLAFGGFSWALDGASAPVAAVLRLERRMAPAGALPSGDNSPTSLPRREIRFRNVGFAYGAGVPVLDDFDLTIPAGTSLAIVGQNGAGKTTLAKLLCRLYDPQAGTIEVDGIDIRRFDLAAWRDRLSAVFQDFVRFELPLRDNVAPNGAPDDVVRAALADAGAVSLADLDTVLSRAYAGGTDLSGGQWQRIALARALCAVRMGAGIVILDEPTAQLDVRGEAEIFERILRATRRCTTILISHRFSTVRLADRICVLEHGKVIELGTHDELMARHGRYRTMFDLQAQRFGETEDEEGVTHDVLA